MHRSVKNIFISSFAFLLLLILTGIATAAPVDSEQKVIVTPFHDVSSSDANTVYIKYMAERGIISGFPDGSFHPGEGLTRAQAAVLVTKVSGLKANPGNSSFSDVDSSHWAAGFINAAASAGYISGFPDGSFHPEENLTKAQGISLFLRLTGQSLTEAELPQLQDLNSSHWAASAIATAIAAGMIETENNSFKPDQAFKRGDLARALSLLITKAPDLNQQELIGQLKVKTGTVDLKRAGSEKTQTINTTSTVRKGDTVFTGKNGEAEINYPDGSGILLKPNSQLIIKTSIGRAYIVKGGKPGTAVEDLQLELTDGKLFGALASKYTGKEETKKTASNNKYSQIASRDKNFGLMAAKTSEQPWYKTAEKKKVKVKVDMPWGVAAIRGSFWSNFASNNGCGMSLLEGDGELSAAGVTQLLALAQSCFISTEGGTPSPPTSMSPSEAREWLLIREWVEERVNEIINNQSTEGLGENTETGLNEESLAILTDLTNLLDILDNALEQLEQIAASAPSGSSDRGSGSSGGGGGGTISPQVKAPSAPSTGNYDSPQSITLSSDTDGATIYYTTDGSDPKISSTRLIYNGPIIVEQTTTIRAYATRAGMKDSAVVTYTYTIDPLEVDAPTANPAPGTYTGTQYITLSCDTDSAIIYYTTDGSAPTDSNNNSRMEYSEQICVAETTTIKAYATKFGMSDSDVVSLTYTINLLEIDIPTATPAPDTYSEPVSVSLHCATEGATIYYTTDGSNPETSSTRTTYSTPVNIEEATTIKAYATRSGMLDSEVVTFTYNIQVNAPTADPPPGVFTLAIKVKLSTTTEGADIYYTTDGTDPKTSSTRTIYSGALLNLHLNTTINAYAIKEGMTDSDVVSFEYTIKLPADAPTASPTPGTYSEPVSVSLSSGTIGTTIYYTTDGSDPKTSGTRMTYSTPVNIAETTTIKAYATKSGMLDSDVVSFEYIINLNIIGNLSSPSLAYNEECQNYLMVYEKNDGNNSVIYGQIWPTDGTTQGAEFTISGPGVNREPVVAVDPNSMNYLVLWSDQGDTPAIRGQIVNPSEGSLEGTSFTVYADENNKPQFKPNIAYYYSGPLVVWQEGDSSSDSNIMGRFITFTDNTPNLDEPISFSQGAGNHYDPAVACNNGEYLVVFNDGNNLKGILIGEGFITDPVSISSGSGIQGLGTVIPFSLWDDDTGTECRFLVVWHEQQQDDFMIKARFVGPPLTSNTPSLGKEHFVINSSNPVTCPSIVSADNYYLIAWQDQSGSSNDNDILARMLYPDGTFAGFHSITYDAGEQLHPTMAGLGNKVIIAYEDQVTIPYTIGRYLFDESPPPKADWIIITNNATGDDEVTTPYRPAVIPVGAVVTVYDGNGSLGSETAEMSGNDGYFPPHIVIRGGFAPGVEGIYVTTTLEGNQESELTTVNIPIPVMNNGIDFDVDNCDYGYGKITYILTHNQKAAMEAATGKTIATIKAYTTTNIETTFTDLAAAEATNGVEILIIDDDNDTNDCVSVEKDPGNYGYAIAAYDSYGQVVAYYVSTEWVTVYAPEF